MAPTRVDAARRSSKRLRLTIFSRYDANRYYRTTCCLTQLRRKRGHLKQTWSGLFGPNLTTTFDRKSAHYDSHQCPAHRREAGQLLLSGAMHYCFIAIHIDASTLLLRALEATEVLLL